MSVVFFFLFVCGSNTTIPTGKRTVTLGNRNFLVVVVLQTYQDSDKWERCSGVLVILVIDDIQDLFECFWQQHREQRYCSSHFAAIHIVCKRWIQISLDISWLELNCTEIFFASSM